jgi:hypothetical protein
MRAAVEGLGHGEALRFLDERLAEGEGPLDPERVRRGRFPSPPASGWTAGGAGWCGSSRTTGPLRGGRSGRRRSYRRG